MQAIAAAHGGHAMLKSASGIGTSVQVWIPFRPPGQPGTGTGTGTGAEDSERRTGPDAVYN